MGKSPVSLDDVLVNSQLTLRPARAPDYKAEVGAIKQILDSISKNPNTLWEKLASTALELCRAGTAGVSILVPRDGTEVPKAEAVVGVLQEQLSSKFLRDSASGAALDCDQTLLMYFPDRYFPALKVDPPIVEALIIPFHVQNRRRGTIWCLAHDDVCKFDSEDERIGKTLASFAAAACNLQEVWGSAGMVAEHDSVSKPVERQNTQHEMIQAKLLREELQQLTQNLESRASEKTADLIASKDQVTVASRQAEDLPEPVENYVGENSVAIPRTVFNSLLNVIQSYIILMRNDVNDPVKLKDDVKGISEAINKSASLVEELAKDTHKG
jgi:hypothetical protein